jgi:thiol-disulfide isomerase/thioredoxin
MKKIILALVLCLALPSAALASSASVPSLNLAGLTDLLAKNKGKVIMLNFFATWCPPCRIEIPELVGVRQKYSEKDVLIVSLSVDEDAKVVPPFVEKMKMQYPVYMAGRDIARAFRISSIPHNAFYSKDGQLVLSEPGMADAEMIEMVFKKLLDQK